MSFSESIKGGYARLKEFLGIEVPAELKKVSWPTKHGVYSSTKAVVVSVLMISVYIGLVDTVFNRLFEVILKVK
ncbi:MAG TPA: preprotein translocase subunit SecE [Candidatus Wallbacteria bacterium]|nr:preprotein translocase subunit SecE [Candidatus Wallbacteria bacterium]